VTREVIDNDVDLVLHVGDLSYANGDPEVGSGLHQEFLKQTSLRQQSAILQDLMDSCCSFIHMFIRSFVHSLTHSFIHSFFHCTCFLPLGSGA